MDFIKKGIKYKSGYKYQLVESYQIKLPIYPVQNIQADFIDMTVGGYLFIKAGYAWDGPSGPAIDTKNFMRGSLVHDALYQLMRQRLLSIHNRQKADLALKHICIEDGMSTIRAWWVYKAVQMFGMCAATKPKPILTT